MPTVNQARSATPIAYSVALGDLDGDGDLDAWVTNYGSQANRVWINQGGDQGGTLRQTMPTASKL